MTSFCSQLTTSSLRDTASLIPGSAMPRNTLNFSMSSHIVSFHIVLHYSFNCRISTFVLFYFSIRIAFACFFSYNLGSSIKIIFLLLIVICALLYIVLSHSLRIGLKLGGRWKMGYGL